LKSKYAKYHSVCSILGIADAISVKSDLVNNSVSTLLLLG